MINTSLKQKKKCGDLGDGAVSTARYAQSIKHQNKINRKINPKRTNRKKNSTNNIHFN